MKLINFGNDSKNFLGFILHSLLLGIPGFILGYSIEKITEKLELILKTKWVVLIQLLLDIIIIFILSRITFNFSSEFQKTYSGLFFVALFFNSQINLIPRLILIVN